MLVAGIDGGATRTRAAIASPTGSILGFGIAGPSNYDNVGVDTARANIGAALDRAWQRAGRGRIPLDGLFLGMAGVVSPGDRETIVRMALDLGSAPRNVIGVDHDIRTALAGGLGGRAGLALIAGTGSSCYGRRDDGRHHRVGWGYLLDDVGSGYWLGLQAMIAVIHEADGRGPRTRLSATLQSALGYDHVDGIMRVLYHDGLGVAGVAALAPHVLTDASSGDRVAQSILERGAAELARSVDAVARTLAFAGSPFPLTLVGGLLESSPGYRALVTSAISARLPECRPQSPELPPVLGAVLLAFREAGVTPTAETVAALHETDLHALAD
jgi:N-acetylglucosamine kinase-like BadF-type ATPase